MVNRFTACLTLAVLCFEVIFNLSIFGFIVACLFSLEIFSIDFLSGLGLPHEAPSIVSMVVKWPANPRGHHAFSSLRQIGSW